MFYVESAWLVHRLDFNNKMTVDQQINFERVGKMGAFKFDADRQLPINPITKLDQFSDKQCLINRFEKSRTQGTVNPHSKPNDVAGHFINMFQTLSSANSANSA